MVLALNLAQFNAALENMEKHAEERAENIARQIYFAFHEELVKATPKKTGRLHSNWNIGHGAPDLSNDNLDASRAASIARGKAELAAWKLGDAEIVISNSVPYAHFVNDGTARMDARDMTGKATRAVKRRFQQFLF